ncbi:MAG: nitrogen regulation protein NR(I) [Candidatus Puniceispirillales bacterium]
MKTPSILLADDDSAIRLVAGKALEKAGFSIATRDSIAGLEEALDDPGHSVLITDVAFPDGDALERLPEIRRKRPDLIIILMSARSTLLTAVKAQERGVYSYLPKPFPLDDLVAAAEGAFKLANSHPDRAEGKTSIRADLDQSPLIGRSPAMQDIFRTIARLVHTDLSVMITGESGTGKEVVARALHDLGDRKSGPFIAINMAAIPHDLIESELFGHEKGAFTGADRMHEGRFAQARGGTLFLDEIGDMPPEAQTRLLRVLQDGQYTRVGGRDLIHTDARIIAATHKDLPQLINKGQFREDLYYRLNVVPLNLPPLRERAQDIPDFCSHFMGRAAKAGMPAKKLADDALDVLVSLPWPGNVRELENLIWRLCVLVDDAVIDADHLRPILEDRRTQPESVEPGGSLYADARNHIERYFRTHADALPPAGVYARIMTEVEKPLLEETLKATGGNQLRAAELLGLNRNTLRKKIRELQINLAPTKRR